MLFPERPTIASFQQSAEPRESRRDSSLARNASERARTESTCTVRCSAPPRAKPIHQSPSVAGGPPSSDKYRKRLSAANLEALQAELANRAIASRFEYRSPARQPPNLRLGTAEGKSRLPESSQTLRDSRGSSDMQSIPHFALRASR